jgi:hypothetical protein
MAPTLLLLQLANAGAAGDPINSFGSRVSHHAVASRRPPLHLYVLHTISGTASALATVAALVDALGDSFRKLWQIH